MNFISAWRITTAAPSSTSMRKWSRPEKGSKSRSRIGKPSSSQAWTSFSWIEVKLQLLFNHMRIVLFAGATSGIGEATAKSLANLRHKVYLASRDMEACEKVRRQIVIDSKNKWVNFIRWVWEIVRFLIFPLCRYVYCRECDLSSFESVRKFVKELTEKETKLDCLINNAGVMYHPR